MGKQVAATLEVTRDGNKQRIRLELVDTASLQVLEREEELAWETMVRVSTSGLLEYTANGSDSVLRAQCVLHFPDEWDRKEGEGETLFQIGETGQLRVLTNDQALLALVESTLEEFQEEETE